MNDTIVNTPRLVELARWLTEQERKRRQGFDSEWNQDVWIRTSRERPVEVIDEGDEIRIQGWSCGTAACAAGHIALEDGGMPAFYNTSTGTLQPMPPIDHHWSGNPLTAIADTLSDNAMFFGNRSEHIDEHAREALGLDFEEANALFEGTNTWDDMIGMIAEFSGIPRHVLLVQVGGDDLPPDPDEDEDW